MRLHYNNMSYYHSDIITILSKFYTAQILAYFHRRYFCKSQGLPVPQPKDKIRKAEIVNAWLSAFRDPVALRKFYDALPQTLQRILSLLAWEPFIPLEDIENSLDTRLTTTAQDPSRRPYNSEMDLAPAYNLVVLSTPSGYGYYSYRYHKPRYLLSLPPAIRTALKTILPKPSGYHLEPVALQLDENQQILRFDASPHIAADLRLIADFIDRGSFKLTQHGQPSATTLREIKTFIPGPDFFSQTDVPKDKKWIHLRTRFIANLLISSPQTLRNSIKKLPANPLQTFRKLLACIPDYAGSIHEFCAPHLKSRYAPIDECIDRQAITQLINAFRQLPADGRWVSRKNLILHARYCEYSVPLTNLSNLRNLAESSTNDVWSRDSDLAPESPENKIMELIMEPYFLGLAFILAAIGLARLLYSPPSNHPTHTFKNNSGALTPFDNLVAVGLTDVGAAAFGLTNSLKLAGGDAHASHIEFHPRRLMAFCRQIDPVSRIVLSRYMEPISNDLFRLTRTTLLGKARNSQEALARINEFRENTPDDLPEVWKEFTRTVEKEVQPPPSSPNATIYDLSAYPHLRDRIRTNPNLRKRVKLLENASICVLPQDLATVKSMFQSEGHFLE